MKDSAPGTVYLSDYAPFGWLIESVHLEFDLDPDATRVKSRIVFSPNLNSPEQEFFLHGENLRLISARIDGTAISPRITREGLTCPVPEGEFLFEAEVEINPGANTALEGLYLSNGMFCTQCEAEGFRKITYYPDRPEVMAVFTVEINGSASVLLSNGNPGPRGPGHALWHDPWPKPSYLFALVAGDLVAHSDRFTTASGRRVDLNLWVRPGGDEDKCAFAMEALKRAMQWDEQVYGREYDLDVFNIVAVDDFNMGAMENKGLNVFNSAAVLASPETSTDANFERIEAIIAHEYFHNWTGNRITCRDWFQLCLKEGLTVFRDAQFTADMRSAPVKRIRDVIDLRARQFPEDNGPLAHPVRPDHFQEINNFYTATVYEKGAEVIGMLKRLVGDKAYAEALELYFARFDGQAITIEDWLSVFEDVTGRELCQFLRWYTQAGTPRVAVKEEYDSGTYTLTFTQSTPPSAASPVQRPQIIPIAVGLLGANGDEVVPTQMLELTKDSQSFTFEGLSGRPVPSILRDFSAPVILEHEISDAERAFLLAHDTDPFNRWEAGQALARETLCYMATSDARPNPDYLEGLRAVLRDDSLDPAYRALMLGLPGESEIALALSAHGIIPAPEAIHAARERLLDALSETLADDLPALLDANAVRERYSPDAAQSGRRALFTAALALWSRRDGGARAASEYAAADNMTLQLGALGALLAIGRGEAETAAFYEQWRHERLVIDKWFAIQISHAAPDAAVAKTRALVQHPDFNWKNPNRFRAVLGALAGNHGGFHSRDGRGYALFADWLLTLDPVNPQTAARMCTAFQSWRHYDGGRQMLIGAQLDRIATAGGRSKDMGEMIARIRAARPQ
ncbi:aminopeptidase N [Pontibaca methylaminivorans]|uniref:Aminopeptidase N n=1 Tax=Pontibaca methylaminivorans TaxID=515897 RepID=A0A1R3WGM2_9RHOB|nr:aminopeptidase N [Pontibaca methylaminivorans]SIT76566.1 aminopeptidase N [Pontibaca methylaminivorans]